jgi:uncharacterized membrane protein
MNINWKQKLSSRKFWVAIVGFITPILLIMKLDAGTIESVTGIVMAGATLIIYILTEGNIDAVREESLQVTENYTKTEAKIID